MRVAGNFRHSPRRVSDARLFTITARTLPEARTNAEMTPVQFEVTGQRPGTTLVWEVMDGFILPPGLTLSTTGLLSGTPTLDGRYDFGIQVSEVGA